MMNNVKFIGKITEGLNEQQKLAVENPLNSCTKIVAGAGTGKTKIISRRYVKLVQDLIEQNIENPLSRLLVITFTDKAANEMKERIFNELKSNGIDSLGQDSWISTFHSFCSRILRKHSIEVNLSPSFKLGEEKQLKDIYDGIIKKIKYGEASTIEDLYKITSALGIENGILNIDSINKLNKINDIETLLDDIYAVIKKIKSLGINAKEFLEKSTRSISEFSNTVETTPFGCSSKDAYYEDWAQHFLKYTDDYCVFDVNVFDSIAKTKLILDKNGARGKDAHMQWGMASGFPENIPKIKETELHLTKVIAVIYAVYQYELEKLDTVDFDDLINKTIQLLKQNSVIRAYYQKLFKHLIIDEFQDTNGAQLELIELLLDSEKANITFVGDRKQSIYGFRFAQMENLEVLHKNVEKKYSQKYPEVKLVTNYRSTPNVLDFVNHVTTNQLNLDEVLIANPQKTKDPEFKHVKVSTLQGFNDSTSHKITEAKYIASEVIRLKKEENANYKDFAVLVKSHSQAELIEKQLSALGIPSIKKVNLGFFLNPVIRNAIALLRLTQNSRDEIALVRVLKIKLSDSELYRLKTATDKALKIKLFDDRKKMNLCGKLLFARDSNAVEDIELAKHINDYVNEIFEALDSISKAKNTLSLLQVYYKLINAINPCFGLDGIDKYKAELELRIFEKIIADFMQGENYVSISKFLDYIDKIKDDRGFELPTLAVKDVDAVQLLTIHASKGLEFPYTFVASITTSSKGGNADGYSIFFDMQYGDKPGFGIIANKFNGKPTAKALVYKEVWKKPRERNEALRLFYVAVSRAEKYLNILSFKPYGNNGATKPIDYIQDLANMFSTEAIDTTELEIEKQEFKPLSIGASSPISTLTMAETEERSKHYKMSFSQINTFKHCPNKYLLQYKYKYPQMNDSKESSIVGSLLHNLIYNSYLGQKALCSDDIDDFLSTVDVDTQDMVRVKELYETFLASEYSPANIERCEIFPERNFSFVYELDGNAVEFSGDIDLLIKNTDNAYSIIDFKTNKNIEKSLPDYYKQLYLYKIALQNEGLAIKELKIVNLKENAVKIYTVEQSMEPEIKAIFDSEIKNVITSANAGIITNRELSENCVECGFNYICRS